uniref:GG17091 n=1 Tax=Drosophila erecta TaxID=7220 RepID=B3P458_DROER
MAAVALTGVVNGSGKYCISQLDTVPGTHSLDQSCDAIEVAILQDEDVDFAEDAVKDVDVNEDGADKCAAWYLH